MGAIHHHHRDERAWRSTPQGLREFGPNDTTNRTKSPAPQTIDPETLLHLIQIKR